MSTFFICFGMAWIFLGLISVANEIEELTKELQKEHQITKYGPGSY